MYTKYNTLDLIPSSDHGFVITLDGTIYALKHRMTHAYIICHLFKDRLKEYHLKLEDIDMDNATFDTGTFAFDMPVIRLARVKPKDCRTYMYDIWYNKHISFEMFSALHHLLYNVYGTDGNESVYSPNAYIHNVKELVQHLRGKL